MNKLLLGTTALVGASILMAGAAYAAKPTLKVSASIKFEVLGSDQDNSDEVLGASPQKGYVFATDSEVAVTGTGVTDGGIKWTARVEFEADEGEDNDADESWIRFSGSWGDIRLGTEDGAEDLMQHGAQKAHGAGDGGVDGDWVDAIDWDAGLNGNRLIDGAKMELDSSDATKATYFTPRVGGVQLGVSFTPDRGSAGVGISQDNDASSNGVQNTWGLGANFVQKIGGASVAISAVGHIGDAENESREDRRTWALGASIGYGNWAVGANYQDLGDSGELKSVTTDNDSTSFSVGVGYSQGPVELGVSYIHSEVEVPAGEDEGDAVVVGATYSLGGGASVYGDIFWFDTDGADAGDAGNEGTGFLIGTAVKF